MSENEPPPATEPEPQPKPKPPNISNNQALAAVAFLCVLCLAIGFVLGRTL